VQSRWEPIVEKTLLEVIFQKEN